MLGILLAGQAFSQSCGTESTKAMQQPNENRDFKVSVEGCSIKNSEVIFRFIFENKSRYRIYTSLVDLGQETYPTGSSSGIYNYRQVGGFSRCGYDLSDCLKVGPTKDINQMSYVESQSYIPFSVEYTGNGGISPYETMNIPFVLISRAAKVLENAPPDEPDAPPGPPKVYRLYIPGYPLSKCAQ